MYKALLQDLNVEINSTVKLSGSKFVALDGIQLKQKSKFDILSLDYLLQQIVEELRGISKLPYQFFIGGPGHAYIL